MGHETRFAVAASVASCSMPWTKKPVDLDHVDREAPQLAEGREAGAEVVDGDSHPELMQLLELGPRPLARMAFLTSAVSMTSRPRKPAGSSAASLGVNAKSAPGRSA
jgi:hypothetical protein